MIRVLGGPKRLCDGLTRRDLLHVGSLGMLGLGLSSGIPLSAARAASVQRRRWPARIWPGQVVHPAIHVRIAEPDRNV